MTVKEKSKKAPVLEVCKIMLKLPVRFFSPTLISNARRGNMAELQAKINKQTPYRTNPLLKDVSKIHMKFNSNRNIWS